ncbi:hypothetical protein CHUAL_004747 [Chamberlinius hualienensis]
MSEIDTMSISEQLSSPTIPQNENESSNERHENDRDDNENRNELQPPEPQEIKPIIGNSPTRQDPINPNRSPSPPSSPESNCPICLGKMENNSFTNTCCHQFCFTCLLEWSKVKPQCPLCKQPFKSIIHSIRSKDDFDRYDLTPDQLEPVPSVQRFRYRTTLVERRLLGRRFREIPRRSVEEEELRPPPRFLSHYRRHVYEYNQWVQPVSRNEGVRRTDTAFYANNPAITHRLVPWLNRELIALNCGSRVAFIIELVLSLLHRYHILSPEFIDNMRPYIGTYTRHFLHEFYHFARSPYDMARYDQAAIYPHATDYPFPYNNDDNDSEVEVVAVVERNNDDSGIPPWSRRNPLVYRARDFLDVVNSEPNVLLAVPPSPVVSPQPGPSGLSNVVQEIPYVPHEVTISSDDEEPRRENETVTSESPRPVVANATDSDIEILDPPPKPPPVIVMLSDEENQPRPSTSFTIKSTVKKIPRTDAVKYFDSDDELNSATQSSSSSDNDSLRKRKLKHSKRKKSTKSKSCHEKRKKRKSDSEADDSDYQDKESGHKKKHKLSHRHHHKHKSKKSKS